MYNGHHKCTSRKSSPLVSGVNNACQIAVDVSPHCSGLGLNSGQDQVALMLHYYESQAQTARTVAAIGDL